jgi:hypothetical protein
MSRGLTIPYIVDADPQAGASPVLQFDVQSGHCTRIFYVDWLNAGIAAYQLLGYPVMDYSDPVFPLIRRYLPQYDADFPWMVCTKISNIKGVGARGYYIANGLKAANYELAKITCEFEMPDYDIISDEYTDSEFDRYRTFEARPAAEYLSIPLKNGPGQLKWSQGSNGPANPKGPQPFPGNVGYIVGNIDYHWEWIQVPFEAMPTDDIQRIIGCVNEFEFPVGDGSGKVAAPGTLLLTGWEPKRFNSPYGLRTWRCGYTVRYNPRGHNNFYDWTAAEPGFYQASTDGIYYEPGVPDPPGTTPWPPDGKLLYNARNFELLFTPPII